MSNLRVRDLMTSNVFTVRPDDSVTTVRNLMDEKHIRHVPVVDEDGAIAGLVSERDLLRRAAAAESDLPLSVRVEMFEALRAREIMTWDIETVEADEDVVRAAEAMFDNKYGCLPVVEGDALVGILTEADFVRFVAESADRLTSAGRSTR